MRKLISWAYHKYVCKPYNYENMPLEDYLKFQKVLHKYLQDYKVDTFEKYKMVEDIVRTYTLFKLNEELS